MLDRLFIQVLDMTRVASLVILVVLLARLCLKRAPKVISYALWGVVLFRLLCPLSIETPVSLVPQRVSTSIGQIYSLADEPISVAGAGHAASQLVGDALNGGLGLQHIPTTERDETGSVRYVTTDWLQAGILVGQYVWAVGLAVMALRGGISYGKLRRKLRTAVPLRDNIYLADEIPSPFVIGLLRPRIYLPWGLDRGEGEYILSHEEHHIKRLDHLWKALAYLALCIHWFNPLVWLAFVLAERDMEMSCDEVVVGKLGGDIRADYSASLLSLALGHRTVAGVPLAFGEGNVKERIRNLGKWKKPVKWAVMAAAAVCVVLTVCLVTNSDGIGVQRKIDGLVAEVRVGEDGRLTALVIETDRGREVGILLTEDSVTLSMRTGGPEMVIETTEEMRTAFQEAIRPDSMVDTVCAQRRRALTTDSGARIPAYEALSVRIDSQLYQGAVTMEDGTQIDMVEDYMSNHFYQLADGTRVLRVMPPYGPADGTVDGLEGFSDLNEGAQKEVQAYYDRRGLLWDEQRALEAAYARYQELGENFRSDLVRQDVDPSPSSGQVMYFATSFTVSDEQGHGTVCLAWSHDAFDRETGAHIETWDLFTVPREEAVEILLDEGGVTNQSWRDEMKMIPWDDHICFFYDGLQVTFEPGVLPDTKEDGSAFFVDYTPAVRAILHDWAIPMTAY